MKKAAFRGLKVTLYLIMILLTVAFARAATLQGTIYDYELNELDNVLIEIDTVPIQQFLVQDGTYEVELPAGEYTLRASHEDLLAEETIVIDDDGTYIFDLFLFTSTEDVQDLWNNLADLNTSSNGDNSSENSRVWAYFVAGGLLLYLLGRALLAKKKYLGKGRKKSGKESEVESIRVEMVDNGNGENNAKLEVVDSKEVVAKPVKVSKEEALASIEQEEPGYIDRAIKIIKDNDGRITQKQLRKEMMDLSESKVSLILTELEHKGKVEKVKRGRGNVILLKEILKE